MCPACERHLSHALGEGGREPCVTWMQRCIPHGRPTLHCSLWLSESWERNHTCAMSESALGRVDKTHMLGQGSLQHGNHGNVGRNICSASQPSEPRRLHTQTKVIHAAGLRAPSGRLMVAPWTLLMIHTSCRICHAHRVEKW